MAAAWWIIQLEEQEAEEQERKRYLKLQRRQLCDTTINPFDILESQFLHLYR